MGRYERVPRWRTVNRRKLLSRGAGLAVLALLALILLNTTEYWMPFFEGQAKCSSVGQGISGPDQFFYEHLIRRDRSVSSPRVSLVTIGTAEGSDLLTDVCAGRLFTASLIDALNGLGARVIAIDKVYGDATCKDNKSNDALIDAVKRSKAKIIVGQGTQHPSSKDATACLVKSENFRFGGAAISRGLTVLNEDDLKIPLRWPVYGSVKESEGKEPPSDAQGETFALVTATAADPGIRTKRLQADLDRQSHPFGTFRSCVPKISASDVLRKAGEVFAAHPAQGKSGCGELTASDLCGRVVVVASESNEDVHPFFGEDILGAQLQADYVDALLSGEYVSELPFWGCVIAFGLWVAGVLILLNLATEEAHGRVLAAVAATLAVITLGLIFGLPWVHVMPPFSFLVAMWVLLLFEGASHLLEIGKKAVLREGR